MSKDKPLSLKIFFRKLTKLTRERITFSALLNGFIYLVIFYEFEKKIIASNCSLVSIKMYVARTWLYQHTFEGRTQISKQGHVFDWQNLFINRCGKLGGQRQSRKQTCLVRICEALAYSTMC